MGARYLRITVKCDYCGNPLQRTPKEIAKHKHQFCRREHHFAFNVKGRMVPCDFCATPTFKTLKDLRRSKHYYCKPLCCAMAKTKKTMVPCKICGNPLPRKPSELKYYKNQFCSHKHNGIFMRRSEKEEKKTKQKRLARYLAGVALKKGTLVRSPCIEEGEHKGKVAMHHYRGYSNKHTLDVQWLCYRHHMLRHKR